MRSRGLGLELEEVRSRWLALVVVDCLIRHASSGYY